MIRAKLYFSSHDAVTLDDARSQVMRELKLAGINGATFYPIDGLWDGNIEKGFVCEVLQAGTFDRLNIGFCLKTIARDLAKSYNQQSVGVSFERIAGAEFVLMEQEAGWERCTVGTCNLLHPSERKT